MTAVIAAASAFTAIAAAAAVLTRPYRLQPAGRHHAAAPASGWARKAEDHLAALRPLPEPRVYAAAAAAHDAPPPAAWPPPPRRDDTAAWLVSEGWRQAAGRWAR